MSEDYGVKYATARDRVLAELKSMQWTSWKTLRRTGGVRYGARIRELRRLGYKIEDGPTNGPDGKAYRLRSLRPGAPEEKHVKIYLPESHVINLLDNYEIPDFTRTLILIALRTFQANKDKL